jgi:hypothetical protein
VSLSQGSANFLEHNHALNRSRNISKSAQAWMWPRGCGRARADVRRAENEIAFKVKEVFYAFSQPSAAVTRWAPRSAPPSCESETRNAVDTGVALEVKAAEVRAQIAQAQHAHGQLQDALRI